MSAIAEARQEIFKLLLEVQDIDLLAKVQRDLEDELGKAEASSSTVPYEFKPGENDGLANEPVKEYPDLSSPEYQVKESVDLEELMIEQGYVQGSKDEWAKYADVFSHISDEETREFFEID